MTIDIDKKFSDGTLLSVDVVVKNLLRVRDSENQIGILFKRFIKSIVAISKDKILIRLSKRCAFFLLLLTTAYTAIVSEKSLCSLKNKKIANLIGSGAYRIKKLNSDIIILTKNEYNELIQKIRDLEYWNKIDKRIENIKVGNAHFHELIEVDDE